MKQVKLESATNGVIVTELSEYGSPVQRMVISEPDDFLRWACEFYGLTEGERNQAVIRFAHWENAKQILDEDFKEVGE